MSHDSLTKSPVFATPSLSVFVTTQEDNPTLVAEALTGRAAAFAAAQQPNVGTDELDAVSRHVVAVDSRDGVIAALRIALGRHVFPMLGAGGFTTSRYFSFTAAGTAFALEAAEASRLWIAQDRSGRRKILRALWMGMVEALRRMGVEGGLFGVVSLVDYPTESLVVLANALRLHFRSECDHVVPIRPYLSCADAREPVLTLTPGVVRNLARAFRSVDCQRPLPSVLYEYLAKGALLAGPLGLDESARKCVIPLYVSGRQLEYSSHSLRS
ncbi:MAG TPA: GNAT family N-acyltransferase [Gemmataceae bacterium]|jgi:hypothetical protein|nr:GNAT family N-acyltransferase [Gemmataceae bacterium]